MNKNLIPLAALTLAVASCATDVKDSYQTIPYKEYNLIVDNQDASQPAQVSLATYDLKNNISKGVVDVKCSDIIINNQKLSFETDTMRIYTRSFTITNVEGGGSSVNYYFSKRGNAGLGSAASDISGTLVWNLIPSSNNLLNPNYTLTIGQRLDLRYILNDRYSIQTFWPTALFVGNTLAAEGSSSFSTKNGHYLADIDFEKKVARVYIYNAEFSPTQDKSFPKVIRFENIPVVFSHNGFTLRSDAPKTTVLGQKDNTITMVDSVGFAASDFKMDFMSSDLTDVSISYNLDGHSVYFQGSSILK